MMKSSFKQSLQEELVALFKINHSSRVWHIPVLAALCVGLPLIIGSLIHNYQAASLASLGGLVILYYSGSADFPTRMITLLSCSFGFLFSVTIPLFFNFDPVISSIAFGVFSILVRSITLYFKTRPPASFFFIMIASMASCHPHDLSVLPEKIGYVGLGTMGAVSLAFLYSLIMLKRSAPAKTSTFSVTIERDQTANFIEALIVGVMMAASLLIGHYLNMKNPYWIAISCLAVLQGVTLRHVWQRMFQRILGTFIGLVFCWILLTISDTTFSIVLMIIVLQFFVETFIVRNYTIAVIFITPLTLLLTEFGNPLIQDPNMFISIRFWDILIGCLLGAIGGFFIHHQYIRQKTLRQLRKTKVILKSTTKFKQ
jgi:uncharacterized membrane protein YgaE (UPF0421/DUF939 family)